ncbi:hypothetical protein Tco_1113916 [Tanacetum coccineum]|uniref:Uncharacterized protein n=1 Tax=Tanacetum coccineum TaxID=301880 RepID=A0ABQ5ITJ6_9ASTR
MEKLTPSAVFEGEMCSVGMVIPRDSYEWKERAHFESEKEAIHLILTGIGDEIYSTVDACQKAQEMWEAIERLQQGETLNIQDVKTNLFWEFGQFTSHDGETIESYYTRFYKMMNEMIRNNLTVATMQVNVQFLQQLQPEWSRFEVNELRAERMAKNANPLALAKQSTPPSESASEEDSDPEQAQRDKDMQKNLALIAKYFKKIYKPTNNNLRTFLKTPKTRSGYTLRNNNVIRLDSLGNQRAVNVINSDMASSHGKRLITQSLEAHYSYMEKIQELDVDENKKIQKQLKKAKVNIDLQEITAWQSYLAETKIVDQAWVKHSNDLLHLRNPTAQDMEILVKTCLMPLALKTQNDSFAFVHELKQEMHADLKYVESLEDELDELESDKAEFSNMYDMLLPVNVCLKMLLCFLFAIFI